MTCSQVSDRIVDLLCGALVAGEKERLESHVVGCARCRDDVGALGRTFACARRALRGLLFEPAPAGRWRRALLARATVTAVLRGVGFAGSAR